MRCVPRTVRSGARLRSSSLGGVSRGDPPYCLSGMVRVSDVPHWTKSAGTIPPYKAVGPVLLEAGHAWGWCASAWAHGGPGGAVSPRGEESGMRGHLSWCGVRWLFQGCCSCSKFCFWKNNKRMIIMAVWGFRLMLHREQVD